MLNSPKKIPASHVTLNNSPTMTSTGLASETPSDLVRRAMNDFEGPLLGFTMGLVGDLESAQDIVQEAFIKLYQQEPGRIVEPGLKSWLYTVCRNRALDQLRRRKRFISVEEESMDELVSSDRRPDEIVCQEEESASILRFIRRLPPNQQEVIRLKFLADLSYKEISAVTGLSATNVGFLIHTALHRLKQLLGPEMNYAHEEPDARFAALNPSAP